MRGSVVGGSVVGGSVCTACIVVSIRTPRAVSTFRRRCQTRPRSASAGSGPGSYPQFIEHFNKMFARSQNALRGRWENFWSSEQACVVKLVDREAVLDKLVYTATNPVQDHLVDRVHHWPGVNGLQALL